MRKIIETPHHIIKVWLSLIAMIATLTFCGGTFCTPEEDFIIDLSLRWSEVSKDTHSDWYNISIAGRNVAYEWKHRGFPDQRGETKKYRLSKKEFGNLKRFISKQKLHADLKESRESGKLGLSVHLYLLIRMDGVEKKASLSGMFNDWTTGKGNIENTEYLGSAGSIVSCFKNFNACHMLTQE